MNMSVNGPVKMYKIRPLYDFSPAVTLPTCMYKMKNVYDETTSNDHVTKDDLKLLEIEKHQLNIIQKLEDLKKKVLKMKEELGVQNQSIIETVEKFQDIVIKANPQHPPYCLWVFYKLLSQYMPVRLITYVHSSLINVPDYIQQLQNLPCVDSCKVSLTIIWREGNNDHEMMIDPIHHGSIEGEVNIARYLARLLNFTYDADPILSTQIDDWLETAHSSVIHGNNKERQAALKSLNSHLGKNNYLVETSMSLADVVMWSALIQTKLHQNLPTNVSKWFKSLSDNEMFAYFKNLTFL